MRLLSIMRVCVSVMAWWMDDPVGCLAPRKAGIENDFGAEENESGRASRAAAAAAMHADSSGCGELSLHHGQRWRRQ
jgi:hypothetical protein